MAVRTRITPRGIIEEYVAAVKLLTGPTTIQIVADPWNDTVVIPGGTWELSDTTIVGTTTYAHGGYNWQSQPGSS